MKALLVKQPWIDKILSGEKPWELRGSRTKIRGPIALIQSGTGTVVGICELADVEGPLSLAKLRRTVARHRVPPGYFKDGPPYPKTYAWVLRGAIRFTRPVSYEHPSGAVIWVNLNPQVVSIVHRITNGLSGPATTRSNQVGHRRAGRSAAR